MSFAYLPLYTGDYLRDTRHLDCAEHGVYILLLMHCWHQRGPAPLDERRLCGIVNARSGSEVEALRRVLAEFFVRMEDGWYNERLMEEIERANAVSSKHRTAAKARWAARDKIRAISAVHDADALQTHSKRNAAAPSPPPPPSLNQKEAPSPAEKGQKTLPCCDEGLSPPPMQAPASTVESCWQLGVDLLTATGLGESLARKYLGSMLKTWDEDTLLEACRASIGKADPKAYIAGYLKGKPKRGATPAKSKSGEPLSDAERWVLREKREREAREAAAQLPLADPHGR